MKGHSFCLFLRSESHGLDTSGAAVSGGAPSLVPRFCETGPGYPPATAAEVAQTFRQSLQNKHKEWPRGLVTIIPKKLSYQRKNGETPGNVECGFKHTNDARIII
jgi:hypothetical protein